MNSMSQLLIVVFKMCASTKQAEKGFETVTQSLLQAAAVPNGQQMDTAEEVCVGLVRFCREDRQ